MDGESASETKFDLYEVIWRRTPLGNVARASALRQSTLSMSLKTRTGIERLCPRLAICRNTMNRAFTDAYRMGAETGHVRQLLRKLYRLGSTILMRGSPESATGVILTWSTIFLTPIIKGKGLGVLQNQKRSGELLYPQVRHRNWTKTRTGNFGYLKGRACSIHQASKDCLIAPTSGPYLKLLVRNYQMIPWERIGQLETLP